MVAEHPRDPTTGLVFDIQRFCLHDGPGIRSTVFLKGCPLRCTWCHNPESIGGDAEVMVRADRCLGCGACDEVCPRPVGPLPAGGTVGDEGCVACAHCIDVCPAAARDIAGRERTVEDVVAAVLRDRLFYDESAGGVTFSGGEPLSQPGFVLACLERLRTEGVRTALDTCGFAPQQVLLDVAARCDLVLYDVKTLDPEAHQRLVGVPLRPILDNLDALSSAHRDIWLRVPVVPGMTDDPERLLAVARLAARLPAVRRVSLLPYHRFGHAKLARLGRTAATTECEPPGPARLEALAAPMRALGVDVAIGG